jgi:hypothetical protein
MIRGSLSSPSPFACGEAAFALFRGQLFRRFFSPLNIRRRFPSYGGHAQNEREKIHSQINDDLVGPTLSHFVNMCGLTLPPPRIW